MGGAILRRNPLVAERERRRADRTQAHASVRLPGLKLQLALEGRLREAFGTTDADTHTVTLDDALTALGRLCLEHYQVEGRITVRRLTHPDERQEGMQVNSSGL